MITKKKMRSSRKRMLNRSKVSNHALTRERMTDPGNAFSLSMVLAALLGRRKMG